jgi:23S rRNA pseudouridine1911/1915/1917 synthase
MNDELYLESDEYDLYAIEFSEEDEGMRLDVALADHIENISRNRARLLIENGDVTVNETSPLKKKFRVHAGDIAVVRIYRTESIEVLPEKIDIDVVYEDDDLMVVNKAKGMVVHPAPGNETGTLVNAALYNIREAGGKLSSINGKLRPGIVHRIDKNTSGLLVIAKNDKAHAALSEQLADHSMTRVYNAIAAGGFDDDEGTIDAPLIRDPRNRKKRKVSRDGSGKHAITHYKVLERFGKFTLLELKLETGRTHQIRVHLDSIGRPVYGDNLYGSADGNGQFLHARTLGFTHPRTKEYMEFSSEPPEDFRELLEKLRRMSGGV